MERSRALICKQSGLHWGWFAQLCLEISWLYALDMCIYVYVYI